MLHSHEGNEIDFGEFFIPRNTTFPKILLQTVYQIWEYFHIPEHVKTFSSIKRLLRVNDNITSL